MPPRPPDQEPDAELRLGRRALLRGGAGALLGLVGLRSLGGSVLEGVARAAGDPAGAAVLVARDEPLHAARGLAGVGRHVGPLDAPRFNVVGLHWRGSGEVRFRTLGPGGVWSSWEQAVTHEEPDPGSAENRLHGWHLGTPVWAGRSTAIEYRLTGDVSALRANFVWSPPVAPSRRPAIAGLPPIVPRSAWGADESIVRAPPAYADRLLFAVVHHTAGPAPKSPGESAALVRGIQRYHVEGNKWNDIGYNFLVDGFGQLFEGRGGGIDRNVIGAHALGFNVGSTGVAVLGNFDRRVPSPGAIQGLVSLLAWRLDVGHVDPLALVTPVPTRGAAKTIRAISGHRDVNPTACPGANLYPRLDSIAQQVAALGVPKLYDPAVEQTLSRVFEFTARLSQALAWTVTVTGPDGSQAAAGGGTGTLVDFTWDATSATDGRYAWSIGAGPSLRPAQGSLAVGVAVPVPAPATPPPPRPGGVPHRIPAWAWQLETWHTTPRGQRGPRPAGAPRRLPGWYWDWFRWRRAVERWKTQQSLGPISG